MPITTFPAPKKKRSWLRDAAPSIAGLGALSVIAVILPGQFGWGSSSPPRHHQHSTLHSVQIEWPAQGEAAVAVVGLGHRASPSQQLVPIASVAKVMTAYIVLRRDPLEDDTDGFTMTFNDADAALADEDKSDGQSYIPVDAGETITEREALEALLLPSANNVADALADQIDGSIDDFVTAMNSTAAELGMRHTTYTDPSGFDPSTVSTAADQLRLAQAAMKIPAFAAIVGMRTAVLPVVGTVTNTDALLGRDGFVGIKTGSDRAAGGCFMFESLPRSHGRSWQTFGVVLGQTGGPLIQAGLAAADQLVTSISPQLPPAS